MIKLVSSCKNEPWCSRLNITKCEALSIHNIIYHIQLKMKDMVSVCQQVNARNSEGI